jgi:hypothetical protein
MVGGTLKEGRMMTDLSPELKIAVLEFVESQDKKKDEKFLGQLKTWLGIVGVSVASILGVSWVSIQDVARRAAEKTATAVLDTEKLVTGKTEAMSAVIGLQAMVKTARGTAEENVKRSEELLMKINDGLTLAQQLKADSDSLDNLRQAAAAFINARQSLSEALKNDPELVKAVAGNVNIPTGIVAAFNSTDSERQCPDKWIPFKAAGGRMIVGAGPNDNLDQNAVELTDFLAQAVGGEEMHRLTVSEMPSHTHSISRRAQGGNNNIAFFDGETALDDKPSTGAQGGDVPHNNMPPFVALYYCIKE